MNKVISAVTALALLSGCSASEQTLSNLRNAQFQCGVGNLQACNDIPYVSHKAEEEAQARTTLLIALPLIPLLVFAR